MTAADRAQEAIQSAVFDLPASDDRFNPYNEVRPVDDRPNAPEIRRANLRRYLEACQSGMPLFLLAEAPGPWGCGFSGVPITSEEQLLDPTFPLDGEQASAGDTPRKEYSASIFWRLLADVFPQFMVWNACPLHPHRVGEPYSIRAPRITELREFAPLAAELIACYQPQQVLAVGRKAERTLHDIGVDATYVRHPSQGGATLFREGVLKALERAGIRGVGA